MHLRERLGIGATKLEDGLLALLFGGLLFLPLVAILARQFDLQLPSTGPLAQHATFWIGLAGAAVAARGGTLLSLSGGAKPTHSGLRRALLLLKASVGAGLSWVLAWAGWEFLQSEREAGTELIGSFQVWMALLPLPAGFLLLAFRQILAPGTDLRDRIGSTVGSLAVAAGLILAAPTDVGFWAGVALLLAGLFSGAPLFALLAGAAALLFWREEAPLATLALDHYRLSTNPTLPALPLFTLAGFILSAGGASTRLIHLCHAVVGNFKAGPALLVILTCAFFTSLTGASGVTILALGPLLLPLLRSARYSENDSIGLITGSGSLGLLFAPCLPLLLYAIVAEIDLQAFFLGALMPGVLLCAVTLAWATLRSRDAAPSDDAQAARPRLSSALREAIWELLVPVVALGSILLGLATPVESAAVTAGYCLFIQVFVHRELRGIGAIGRVFSEAGSLIGGVLLILGVALGLTNYLIDMEVPAQLVDFVREHVSSRWMFLLLLTLVLLVVGCLMDVFSAIIVVVPLLVPLGVAYGIHPVHLGCLFLSNLGLGYLTPPVGMNLFLASQRFEKPMSEVLRSVQPIFWIQLGAVLLIAFIPGLSTWLPSLVD